VVAFGKHLDEPAIDCGAFLLPVEVFGCQRQAAAEGDHTLAGGVTCLAQDRPLRAIALPRGCWWRDVDTPRTRARRGWRCAARWARPPTGRSAAGSTGPCRPGCRWRWRRCGPRPTWCRWSGSRSAWPGGAAGGRPGPGGRPAGSCQLGRRRRGRGGGPATAAGRAAGALLDGVLDRVADAAILAGLGLWALEGHGARGVLALTVAATAGALLSMASKDRAAAVGLPPAPERALGWLAGWAGRAPAAGGVGALLGAPLATLAAVTATSALSLSLRVAFLRRPPAT